MLVHVSFHSSFFSVFGVFIATLANNFRMRSTCYAQRCCPQLSPFHTLPLTAQLPPRRLYIYIHTYIRVSQAKPCDTAATQTQLVLKR